MTGIIKMLNLYQYQRFLLFHLIYNFQLTPVINFYHNNLVYIYMM